MQQKKYEQTSPIYFQGSTCLLLSVCIYRITFARENFSSEGQKEFDIISFCIRSLTGGTHRQILLVNIDSFYKKQAYEEEIAG